jgi:hypothetical protein
LRTAPIRVQVCGEGGGVEGDAVVPLRSALLPGGARRIVLRGVYHSMSRIGTFDEDSGKRGDACVWRMAGARHTHMRRCEGAYALGIGRKVAYIGAALRATAWLSVGAMAARTH